MGKICIINALVASLFMQKLAVLPLPADSFFKQYKDIILEFLWEGKAHKVSYNKIIQDYTNGGLKLVDLRAKAIALKAKWPLYYGDRNEDWLYNVANVDHRVWQYNISAKDGKK